MRVDEVPKVEFGKALSPAFGDRRKRRAQLIRALKQRRRYPKPVRGGTGKRKVRVRFSKHLPGRHNQKDHGRWARGIRRRAVADRIRRRIVGVQLTLEGGEEPIVDTGPEERRRRARILDDTPAPLPGWLYDLNIQGLHGQLNARELDIINWVEEKAPGFLERVARSRPATLGAMLGTDTREWGMRFVERTEGNTGVSVGVYNPQTGKLEVAHFDPEGKPRSVEEVGATVLHELGHRLSDLTEGRLGGYGSGFFTSGIQFDVRWMLNNPDKMVRSRYADPTPVEKAKEAWIYPISYMEAANKARERARGLTGNEAKRANQLARTLEAHAIEEAYAEAVKLYFLDRDVLDDTLDGTLTNRIQESFRAIGYRPPRKKARKVKKSLRRRSDVDDLIDRLSDLILGGKAPEGLTVDELRRLVRSRRVSKHYPGGKDHDQKRHGDWARGISGRQRLKAVRASGGFTISVMDGTEPVSGYIVAIPGAEEKYLSSSVTPRHFASYKRRKWDRLNRPGRFWGAWVDNSSGREMVYFDIAEQVDDLEEAKRLGRERNQLAIWDVANGVEIRLDQDDTDEKEGGSDG